MAQVAEIKFGQKVMEKETEKRISEIEGLYPAVKEEERGAIVVLCIHEEKRFIHHQHESEPLTQCRRETCFYCVIAKF